MSFAGGLTGKPVSASFLVVSTDNTDFDVKAQRGAYVAPARRKPLARVWQWFSVRDEMNAARRTAGPPPVLTERARVAAEVARRVAESPEPFRDSVMGPVCELYRESVHWSLQSLAASRQAPGAAPSNYANLGSVWGFVDPAVLSSAEPDAAAFADARHAVDHLKFDDIAELSPERQAELAASLRSIALALLAENDLPQRTLEALLVKRLFRLGLLVVLLLLGVGLFAWAREARERSRDLAFGRPWRASSAFGQGGCKSPLQECPDSPEYFFHTEEEQSPWLEFDLGSMQRLSAVRIVNRKDCCEERAAPLVVEVSSDDKAWKVVAERAEVFNSWLGKFAPVDARWVRVRSQKKTHLHLQQVRILR